MNRENSALDAMLRWKCPQCREGNLFENQNAYVLKKTTVMHSACPRCGEDFQREPGFYFGAAYVSYALSVALWIAILVALSVFNAIDWIEFGFYTHVGMFLSVGITSLILLLPLIYRWSRTIWLGMFVKRNEKA